MGSYMYVCYSLAVGGHISIYKSLVTIDCMLLFEYR